MCTTGRRNPYKSRALWQVLQVLRDPASELTRCYQLPVPCCDLHASPARPGHESANAGGEDGGGAGGRGRMPAGLSVVTAELWKFKVV